MEEKSNNGVIFILARLILWGLDILPTVLVNLVLPTVMILFLWDVTIVRLFGVIPINFFDSLALVLLAKTIGRRVEK